MGDRRLTDPLVIRNSVENFRDTHSGKEGVLSVHTTSVKHEEAGRGWAYGIKVRIIPGSNPEIPKHYNGYKVLVEED